MSNRFDPFGDFAAQGHLRNRRGDTDLRVVKAAEHNFFEANIDDALGYLARCKSIGYADFLEVHRILFADYYPWAGQDRATTTPGSAITKGDVLFSHPLDARRAVEHGLRIGQNVTEMARRPGEVMGLFAFGHPFLDGNGRTMLLVHIELCHRAGFWIDWGAAPKDDYLVTLGEEIAAPGRGTLDRLLLPLKRPKVARDDWGAGILAIKGLDGLDDDNQVDGDLSDPAIAEKYRQLEVRRGYSYAAISNTVSDARLGSGKPQRKLCR